MLSQGFIKNYSSVIIENERDNIDDLYSECLKWDEFLRVNPLVLEKFRDRVMSARDKEYLFEGLFPFAKVTYKYFSFLILENKCEYWQSIVKNCIREYKRIRSIGTADIVSAFPLDKQIIQRITDILKDKFKLKDVEVKNRVDESIINGVIIYLNNFRLDLSLRKIFV